MIEEKESISSLGDRRLTTTSEVSKETVTNHMAAHGVEEDSSSITRVLLTLAGIQQHCILTVGWVKINK